MKRPCRLCLRDAILRRSHIVPEFAYRPVFGSSHTAVLWQPKKLKRSYRQTGYWDRLLCDACENRLSGLERYFADVWFYRPLRPDRLQGPTVRISGLDYTKFKLFHLSILWRAGVTALKVFSSVSLGRRADDMRQRILANDPGPPDVYPITGLALRNADGSFREDLMLLPLGARVSGHHVYEMLFGGVFWLYDVSGHRKGCPIPSGLESEGRLTLFVQDWTQNLAIRDLAKTMQKHLHAG